MNYSKEFDKKTKTILVFLLLKLTEFLGVFGLSIGLYFLGKYFTKDTESIFRNWGMGLLAFLAFLILAGFVCLLLYGFITLNWYWSKLIVMNKKEKKEYKEEKRKKRDKRNKEIYGYTIGDYVKIKKATMPNDDSLIRARDSGKKYKVIKVSSLGTTLENLKNSYYLNNRDFELVKRGKR